MSRPIFSPEGLTLGTCLVALALLSGHLWLWMWVLAVLSVLTAVVRASQTFKEEMA